MTSNCPLCGSIVYSLAALRWQDMLAQMPAPLKAQALKQQTNQPAARGRGRWLYATKDGGAYVCSPVQMQQIMSSPPAADDWPPPADEQQPFGEDH